MKKTIIATGVALAVLSGCAGQPTQTTVDNGIAAAEIALTEAQRAALLYANLPRCPATPATPICSDQATVDKIKAADRKAYAAVMAAKSNSALVGAALAAIGDLTRSIPAQGGSAP